MRTNQALRKTVLKMIVQTAFTFSCDERPVTELLTPFERVKWRRLPLLADKGLIDGLIHGDLERARRHPASCCCDRDGVWSIGDGIRR